MVVDTRQGSNLRARNYEVMANGGFASYKLRAINLIVLVKTNLCSLFLRNYFKKTRNKHCFFEKKIRPCRVTRRYSISIDE